MIYYGRGFLAVGQVCGCGLGESQGYTDICSREWDSCLLKQDMDGWVQVTTSALYVYKYAILNPFQFYFQFSKKTNWNVVLGLGMYLYSWDAMGVWVDELNNGWSQYKG